VLENSEVVKIALHSPPKRIWQAHFNSPSADYPVFVHTINDGTKIIFQDNHNLKNAAENPYKVQKSENREG
jgi:hypothetical protein